ncbi:MAG TPA: hypothetical protein PK156_50040 [Polyangium sp.]|nr:hypothetical protein [Polyangium sp.]
MIVTRDEVPHDDQRQPTGPRYNNNNNTQQLRQQRTHVSELLRT